jgi:tetratricopeptide (TPR) repeat protein
MAPEQASGPKKGVTVAADVYGLGAVLFELLTGRPPFKADSPLETLVQVLEQPPPRPRALAPAVPHDLETICLKCLEKDPGRRYASAEALAEDLRRFLDGEPILARPAGTAERLWRWGRRAPVVAGLAAALALAVTVGLVAVTVLWQRAEAHLRRAESERAMTRAALHTAEVHRRQAEETFQEAHQIVERMCMRLSEERLSAFQGLQPLRKEMLEAGLKYYQDFLARRGDDPALKADLALAHFRVAFLTNLIGSKRDALASYGRALATYEELGDRPGGPDYREQIAQTCINMGTIYEATGDRKAALASYERARNLLEPLDRERPNTTKVLGDLGIVYNDLGNVYRGLKRFDDARDAYDLALAVQERLVRDDRDNPQHQRELAVVYVNVALLHAARDEKDEAMRWHQMARDVQEKLFREYRHNSDVQHDLALSCRRIGDRLVHDGEVVEGLRSLQRGHELIDKLATANPSVTEFQWELALSHRAIGYARGVSGEKKEAIDSYQAAADLLRKARRQDLSAVVYRRDLAATLSDLGLLLVGEDQKPEAARAYGEAVALYRELAHLGSDPQPLADLAAACISLGSVQRELKQPANALTAFAEARDAREQLVHLRHDEAGCRNDLASAWFSLALAQAALKKRDDEVRSYERSREIRERLVKELPENVAFHHDLGATLINLGYAYAQTGHLEDGLEALRRAVEEKRTAFMASPQVVEYRRGLNNAYGALAEVERKQGTPGAAAAALRERRKLWPDQPQELYRIACEQADTARRVARDRTELSAAEQAERALYLDEAMDTLRLAVAAGFADAERLSKDANLAPLRQREDFARLLAGLKK